MRPIQFRQNPAFVSVGDALGLAFDHLLSNLQVWLLPALAYAIVIGGITGAVVGNLMPDLIGAGRDPENAQAALESLLARAPAFIGVGILTILGSIALSWLLYALAVGGLPGRQMTVDTAISAGVRTILAGIVYAVFVLLVFVVVFLGLGVLVRGNPGVVFLLFLVLAPVGIYLQLRFAFAFYAIFDGAGPIDGFRMSWGLSGGAVLRILGWSLLIGLIGFVISIGTSILGGPMASIPAAAAIVSTLFSTIQQAFQVTMMGILYESQLMRIAPPVPGALPPGAVAAGPVAPGGIVPATPIAPVPPTMPPATPPVPSDPLQPPPPPPPPSR